MTDPQIQWVISVAEGDPIPDSTEVVRVLQTEERPVYGSTASKRYYVLLVRDATTATRFTAALSMDNYEMINLEAGLETLRKLGLDTGDWLGQLLWKIDKYESRNNHIPNQTVEEQLDRVEKRFSA